MVFTQGHALVIGIGTYKYTPKRNVPVTRKDAEQVAQVLRDPQRCGYPEQQVMELTGKRATRQAILDALDQLAALKPADTVFLFYAGHGDYDKDGVYYLTTYDTEMDEGKVIKQSGVRQDKLLKKIRAIPAGRMLLVFNACHSGAVSPGMLGDEEETGQSVPQEVAGALLSAGEGRIIITACREQQQAYYERGENTPMTIFTQQLVAGLNGQHILARKGAIGVFDLYAHVYDTVCGTVYSKYKLTQEPELTVSKGVGVMAVALHQGQAQQGELGAEDRPGDLGGVVHELDADQSRELYKKGVSLQIGQIGNRVEAGRNAAGGHFFEAGRDQTNVGNTTTIGGDYIRVGNIRGAGIAIGRNASSSVSSGAPLTHFDPPGSDTPMRPTLQEALNKVHAAEAQARESGFNDICYELQRIAGDLEVARQAEVSGDTARRRQRVERALRDLGKLVAQDSRVQPLLSIVQQVS